MTHTAAAIAQTAARLVVEQGLEYGAAKHRALKALGLPARTSLPDNHLVEDAVREHLALFCRDTQPQELAALRELALSWMLRLEEFGPLLGGAVWRGTATRLNDIHLHLFADEDGESTAGFVNSVAFYDEVLSAADIAALGGASAAGIELSL